MRAFLLSPLQLQSWTLSNVPALDPLLRTASTLFADSSTAIVDVDGSSTAAALWPSSSLLEQLHPSTFLLCPETVLAPLNDASEPWVRALVWTDFRVAVAFFVVAPLILLSWAVAARFPLSDADDCEADDCDARSSIAETVLRYMTSYWQASSLLLLTVALDVQESKLCVFAGLFAQAMIVVSLWWWEDLNRELSNDARGDGDATDESNIGRVFSAWRAAASVAAAVGVAIQVPFQTCAAASSLAGDPYCAPWLEPPRFAASVVGLEASPTLSNLAGAGCVLYALVLAYYGAVLLPSVGRAGRARRPAIMDAATPVGAWRALGFLDPPDPDE